MFAIHSAKANWSPSARIAERQATLAPAGLATRERSRAPATTTWRPDFDTVVSGLYEAAAMPHMWPDALMVFAEFCGGSGATISRPDQGHRVLASSTDIGACTLNELQDGDRHGATRRGAAQALVTPGPKARWFAACSLTSSLGSTFCVSIQRTEQSRPLSDQHLARIRSLEGHFKTALGLACAVAYRADEQLLDRLNQNQMAAFLLGFGGRVIAHNASAELCLSSVVSVRLARLRALEAGARAPLDALINDACAEPGAAGGDVLAPLKLTSVSGDVMLARASPLAGAALPLGESRALLTLGRMRSTGADVQTLTAAFGLTPAEARVAQLISQGRDLPAVAEALELSLGAVRFHLKSILPKAGVARQAAFVALAASLSHFDSTSVDAAPRLRPWPGVGPPVGRPMA